LRNGDWAYDEMLRTLAFYGSLSTEEKQHLPKADLANLVQKLPRRSIGSVKMRISNFIARDPQMKTLGVAGLSGGGAHCDLIWETYSNEAGHLDISKLTRACSTLL
jgi:hypothetical protein